MSVDTNAIARAVGTLPLVGNEEGLIPAFGLYLTRHFATFYNRASFALLHAAEARSEDAAAVARASLVEAGHCCAVKKFWGVILSQGGGGGVMPMVESREDWVHGIVGVINALGWGVWRVDALRGGEELTVSIANSYESDGYLADYPRRASDGVCFLATGGVAGIMNLVYHGDIAARPALDDAFYQQLFHAPGRFEAREIACRAAGAERCEVVARRVGA